VFNAKRFEFAALDAPGRTVALPITEASAINGGDRRRPSIESRGKGTDKGHKPIVSTLCVKGVQSGARRSRQMSTFIGGVPICAEGSWPTDTSRANVGFAVGAGEVPLRLGRCSLTFTHESWAMTAYGRTPVELALTMALTPANPDGIPQARRILFGRRRKP
jgi:hypothetical protein